jgi:hypothetical protein
MTVVKCGQSESYISALHRTVDELGQAKRQEILDLLLSGVSVGKIVDKLQIETVIVGQVICDNIKCGAHYISKEAI